MKTLANALLVLGTFIFIQVGAQAQTPSQILDDSVKCAKSSEASDGLQLCKANLQESSNYFSSNQTNEVDKIQLYHAQYTGWSGVLSAYGKLGDENKACRAFEASYLVHLKQKDLYSNLDSKARFAKTLKNYEQQEKNVSALKEYCRNKFGELHPLSVSDF